MSRRSDQAARRSPDAPVEQAAREMRSRRGIFGPRRSWWQELWRPSPVTRVIRESGEIEVGADDPQPHTTNARPLRVPRPVREWLRYAVALAAAAVAGLTARLLRSVFGLEDPAMVFLSGVLVTAVVAGLGPSIVASLVSLLVYDFFFVEPRFTFTVTQPQDVISLIVFLVVATLTSQLMARARDQADLARQREARTMALYTFARQIAGAVGIDDLLPVVVAQLFQLFGTSAAVLTPEGEHLAVRAQHPPPDVMLGDAELAAAAWVWRHDEAAGPGTETLPGGAWLYVPLETARGVVGVLGLRTAASGVSLDQRRLLEALARQTAVAIERTRIDVVLAEQAKTEAVIEAIEDGIIVLDPQAVVADVNEVACAILEVERADVLGRRFDDLATTRPHYLRLREAVRELEAQPQRERDRVEITLFLRGRDHHYVLRPTPFVGGDGSPAGLILTLQDVTYLRDQEARRENLVATLSHELRTPLTSLRMALELLRQRREGPADEQRALIDTAYEDVMRLQEVAQQFLDLARARAMTIAVERHAVDLAAVVDRVERLLGLQAQEKGVTLQIGSFADTRIAGDETKLAWALSNLVANALRYTPQAGRVRIDAEPRHDVVLVSVTDSGPGIPPERQDRIFERFTQYDGEGDIGAAGLGLAIVRDIVQAHGGRVLLESAPGSGTRFTLELPRD